MSPMLTHRGDHWVVLASEVPKGLEDPAPLVETDDAAGDPDAQVDPLGSQAVTSSVTYM